MKKFDKLSLKIKLLIFNSTLFFSLIFVSFITLNILFSSNTIIKDLSSNEASHWLYQSMIIKSDIQLYLRISLNNHDQNKEGLESSLKDVSNATSSLTQALQKYVSETKFTQEEQDYFNKTNTNWTEINKNIEDFIVTLKENKSKKEDLTAKISKIEDGFLNLNDQLSEMLSKLRKNSIEIYNISQEKEKYYFLGLLSILSFGLLISVISFIYTIKISSNFKLISNELNIQSKDINKIVSLIKKNSSVLVSSMDQQSSSIHETTAAINEITSTVNRTNENTKELFSVSKTSLEKSEIGQTVMKDMLASMKEIYQSNEQLQVIADIIKQINSKTAVINEIVAKTELLSLNASIESARAGEHGKGFAVVAEEVGNLAKISGKSAHEIQELITQSEEKVRQILDATRSRFDGIKNITDKANFSFQEISENISSLSNYIEQITNAAQEQEIGVRQISTAMLQIENSTRTIQESVASNLEGSQTLVNQSENLEKTSLKIGTMISGENTN